MTDKKRFASLKARSTLMMALSDAIQEQDMTQTEAAVPIGVTAPRISDLMRGKFNLFSLDSLMDMAATAGRFPVVSVTKPRPVRRSSKRAAAAAHA